MRERRERERERERMREWEDGVRETLKCNTYWALDFALFGTDYMAK